MMMMMMMAELLNTRSTEFMKDLPGIQTEQLQRDFIARTKLTSLAAYNIYSTYPANFIASLFQALTYLEIQQAIKSVISILKLALADLSKIVPKDEQKIAAGTALIKEWESEYKKAKESTKQTSKVKQKQPKEVKPQSNVLFALVAAMCWALFYKLIFPYELDAFTTILGLILPSSTLFAFGIFVLAIAINETHKKKEKEEQERLEMEEASVEG